jgi:hypothetical protein
VILGLPATIPVAPLVAETEVRELIEEVVVIVGAERGVQSTIM